jgi:DNA polymerase/3'-5' exonuclease PolX
MEENTCGRDRRETGRKRQRTASSGVPRNLEIAEFFLQLSKLYEQAPCLPYDEMKARQYHLIAGRLQKMDFEIDKDTPLAAIRRIPIIGLTTAGMIKEIVDTGRLRRLEYLQKDPVRTALRNLMAIWGVGRATALSLVHRGFTDISTVRNGIRSGDLSFLGWRQRIGVECYEDLLEDMGRAEVEIIFGLIQAEAQRILPGCEAEIMGSYRRGKDGLGDLDVLIVSREHESSVPASALPEIVNNLTRQGYVAHHLTLLPGLVREMDGEGHELDHTQGESPLDPGKTPSTAVMPSRLARKKSTSTTKSRSSTYMGIFHSPMCRGKRRRVDIKIWPYRHGPYARLYFTGGKYFNRSMRQWAKSKFNWRLNDKGIFDIGSGQRLHPNIRSEEQVFAALGIVYKTPPERKFFDDVHPISDQGTQSA